MFHPSLNVIDIRVTSELDSIIITIVSEGIGLVDLGGVGKLAVRLEVSGLLRGVLDDDISLLVLEVSKRNQDDISLVDPNLYQTTSVRGSGNRGREERKKEEEKKTCRARIISTRLLCPK